MNKIYKVIWSKVRNCYVAVSEIAKRNGKSCTSVNCGTKANRGHAGVALAIALSLSLAGGGVAWGATPVSTTPYIVSSSSYSETEFKLVTGSSVFTVSETGSIKGVYSAGSNKTITIKAGGSVAGEYLYGCSIIAGASGNTVDVYGTVENDIWGGTVNTGSDYASAQNSSTNNTVNIYTGAVVNGRIYGSYAVPEGASSQGTVNINGGSVTGDVKGAVSGAANTSATGTVNVRGGTVTGIIYGADTYSSGSNAIGTVNISGGTVENYVYGAHGWDSGTNAKGVVNVSGGNFAKTIYGSYGYYGANATGSSVTITKTDSFDGSIYGGYAENDGNATGNTVTVKGGTIGGSVYGSHGANATGTVNISGGTVGDNHIYDYVYGAESIHSSNTDATGTVNISGGTVNADVVGSSAPGKATGVVKVTGGTVYGSIYGSRAFNGNASGNTVTIGNGVDLIYNGVCGGHSANGDATGNTIILEGVAIGGLWMQGGSVQETGDPVTGNTLILTKPGNTVSQGRVYNFQTIEFSNSLGWTANSTVLSADKFPNNDDGTRATLDISKSKLTSATTKGTMTLLKSNQANDFNTLSLKYSGGTATLNSSNQRKDVKTGTEATESSPVNGVTLKYKDAHTVSLDAANSYKNVLYTVGSNVSAITLGNMTWGTGRTMASGFDFANVSSITASNLKFSNPDAVSGTMNLLSGATGLAAGKTVTGANHSQDFTKSLTNGVSLSSTLAGTVSTVSGAVKYTASGTMVNSVALGSWNGTGTSAVPTGWTAKSGGATVETGSFTLPSLSTGQTKDILTATTANFFGAVSGARAYTSSALSSDTANGVTLAGTRYSGVKAENSGKKLTYYADTKNVTGITLGNMTWGTGRTIASGSLYTFGNVSSVTASNLKFSNPDAVSGTMNLLSGATGLAAGKTVTGASHSQDFTKSLTNGVSLSSTLKGTVSTVAGAVKYTASGTTVNSVDLGSWDSSKSATDIPSGWTATSGGVTVTTGSFTLPSLSAGQTKDILTATTANFFGAVSGARAYTSSALSSDTANGVTLAGTSYSGVKAENSGKKLTYYADTNNVTGITLDNMTWGTGRTIASGSLYTFGNVSSVTASNLKFSNPDAVSGTMNLLSGATGLAAGKTVTGASHSQDFTKSLTNGVSLSSTLKGTVSTVAGAVKYTASGTTVNSIDLGSWDSSKSAVDVPTGWTLANGAAVETEGMTAPSNLNPGQKKTIITADGTDYFDGITINGSNVWSAGTDLTSDLTVGGVTIAGTQTAGGVKVNEADKSQIVYEESKKNVTSITLGEVIYAKDGIARSFVSAYDLSNAMISADGLTFTSDSKTLMETGDAMIIVDASDAIANSITGQKLSTFEGKDYIHEYTDTITGKGTALTGTHTDTLSQSTDTAKSKLIYTVGAKMVATATLDGTIDWNDGGTHYTNGSDTNQNGTNATYTFNDSSTVDISGVAFNATTDPLDKSMTLLKGVTGVAEEKISGTPSFAVALGKSNTKLDANASGTASVSNGDLLYTVNGVAIDKINVTSITSDADTVPDGWTLAKDSSDKVIASVETGGLSISDPSGLEPGETKVIIEAAAGSTDYFKDVSVNGSYAWKADGSDITSDLDIGGVAITGTQTKGGVKVNEADTNQIIYEESKKLINTLTLGNIEFKIDDGTAATVARTFDKTYDVSTASISADDLAFTNSDIMETGNTMRIVDASAAIPNVSSGKNMSSFKEQTYNIEFADTITGKGITFKGTHTDTLSQDAGQTALTYTVGDKVVSKATVSGDIGWQDGGTHYTNGGDANQNGTKATYTFNENSAVDISGVAFKADSDPLAGSTKSMTLLKGVTGVVEDKISGAPSFAVTLDQTNTKLEATATGAASIDEAGSLNYTVTAVELNTVTVNGTGNDALPEDWTVPGDVVIDTDSMTVPTDVAAGESKTILTAGVANLFSDEDITGANAYSTSDFTDTDAANIVTVTGTQSRGVTTADEGKSLVYKVGFKEVDNIDIGAVTWEKGATVMDGSTGYDYGNVTAIGTDNFDVTYDTPEKVAAGESMTLLKANETLKDMAAGSKSASYSFEPVAGVTVDAALTGNLAAKDGAVTYTVDANRASNLTFGGVEWKDTGALLARPANIVFAGADVDTSSISFTNVSYLDANRKMTLVSDFGDSVGNITGKKYEVGKYTIGTAFEGEGVASLSGSDLIFTTTTDAGLTGQTHKTVMAMDAGLAMLLTGNEFVGKTMDGLAEVKNKGKDGVSTFASVGGGASRYATGSHVNTHTWNAVVGVGKTNETKKGTMEYGVFGEYGKGSYTLHSDDGKGDGDAHYAGGGLLAKWTNKHDVYTEASIRAGRLSDSSSDIMQDGLGNKYGYDVHANYYGAHIGAGKIIHYKGGKSLDVYGKFFYLKRDGVEYDAVQHYNLDSVSSSILRIGGRYGTTDKKWNWYGGLAYEYEFDGEAKGVVNGKAIRAASVKGSSVRGEFGMRMDATKTNPWQTDISLYGYAGKHRGFGGSVSVAYTF